MKITAKWIACGINVAALTLFAGVDVSKLPPAASKQGVTFDKDVRPLFEASCVRCHGAEKPKEGIRLDNRESVIKGGKEGAILTVGKSETSKVVIAISMLDEHSAMPPKPKAGRGKGGSGGEHKGPPKEPAKPLTAEEVGLVRAWIDQGCK